MNEKDWIIETIKEWCRKYAGIHVRYAYEVRTAWNIVEVSPEEIRRGNEAYMKDEHNLYIEFMELFPEKDLLISEPCEEYDMSNTLFQNAPYERGR